MSNHNPLLQALAGDMARIFGGPRDEPLPWLEDDENVAAEDQPWPVVASLCDDIPLDPFRQLGEDSE